MGTASLIARRPWLLPALITTLALAACGQTPAGGPGALTTLPTTTASFTSASPTSTPSTAPATSSSPATTTSSAPGEPTPAAAIEAWMEGQGFVYAGECASTTIEDDVGKHCSSLCEDLGDRQVHKEGMTFSEYTTWLLVERQNGTWRVTDTADDTGTAPAPW